MVENFKALAIIVVIIMVIDIVVAPDPLATLSEGFILTIIAYTMNVKRIFGVDPYALVGAIEEIALILWLFGSILWNIYVVHNYTDQSAVYTAAITAWFVPAFLSAIGTGLAYTIIETVKKAAR